MRAFYGLLKPLHDESLSSWLNRMLHLNYVDSTFETEILRLAARDPGVKGDLDLIYKSSAFLDLFKCNHRPQILAQFEMVETHAVPSGVDDKYCRLCFQNDISACQTPIWRKSWKMRGASVCVLHDRPVLLSRLIERPKDLRDRGWQGYQEYLDSFQLLLGYLANHDVVVIAVDSGDREELIDKAFLLVVYCSGNHLCCNGLQASSQILVSNAVYTEVVDQLRILSGDADGSHRSDSHCLSRAMVMDLKSAWPSVPI